MSDLQRATAGRSRLTNLSPTTAGLLKNPEVIAVDQDPLGLQGVKVSEGSAGLQV